MSFLENYQMQLDIKTPVHIGNRTYLTHKDFILLERQKKIIVPNMKKFMAYIIRTSRAISFENFMLNEKYDLYKWLRDNRISIDQMRTMADYSLDLSDLELIKSRNSYNRNQNIFRISRIETFIKDAYNKVYIPGSSIKGVIRTALLANEILMSGDKYLAMSKKIEKEVKEGAGSGYLNNKIKKIEEIILTNQDIEEDKENIGKAMSYIRVSDSKPIETSKLILAQKLDYKLDKTKNFFPLYREAIRPATKVYFDISIDREKSPYSIDDIIRAIGNYHDHFMASYTDKFVKKKPRKKPQNILYLGRGGGFAYKTLIYSLFEQDEAITTSDLILKKTLGKNYNIHRHYENIDKGIAPHILKCTKYKGKIYEMGRCEISVKQVQASSNKPLE